MIIFYALPNLYDIEKLLNSLSNLCGLITWSRIYTPTETTQSMSMRNANSYKKMTYGKQTRSMV